MELGASEASDHPVQERNDMTDRDPDLLDVSSEIEEDLPMRPGVSTQRLVAYVVTAAMTALLGGVSGGLSLGGDALSQEQVTAIAVKAATASVEASETAHTTKHTAEKEALLLAVREVVKSETDPIRCFLVHGPDAWREPFPDQPKQCLPLAPVTVPAPRPAPKIRRRVRKK